MAKEQDAILVPLGCIRPGIVEGGFGALCFIKHVFSSKDLSFLHAVQASGNPSPQCASEREGVSSQGSFPCYCFSETIHFSWTFCLVSSFTCIELTALSQDFLGNKESRGYCYITHCSFTWINQFQVTYYRKGQNWQPLMGVGEGKFVLFLLCGLFAKSGSAEA